MIDRDCLKAGGEAVGVPVDADLAERLDTYARLLVEWNEKMNLTAITEPGAMVVKHFVDSLAAAPLLPAGPLRLIDGGRFSWCSFGPLSPGHSAHSVGQPE